MMEALLEIVDQLLYLLDQYADDDHGQSAQMIALLEGLASEALALAKHLRTQTQYAIEDEHAERRELLLQRALEAIAYMRLEDAERILEEALEEFPEHDDYYNHLGLVAWERGDMLRAERYYARAAQLALTHMGTDTNWFTSAGRNALRAMEGQALCLYRLGHLESAGERFETLAMTCVPDYQGCYYLAGEIQHTLGHLDKAIELYQLSPSEPSVLYNLALAYYCKHDLEQCTTTLLQAFRSNRFICQVLLGRPPERATDVQGYLASPSYAEEFLEACQPIWENQHGALAFIGRCYDHPLIQQRLLRAEQEDARMLWALGFGPEVQPHAPLSTDELNRYRGLAQRLLEQLLV